MGGGWLEAFELRRGRAAASYAHRGRPPFSPFSVGSLLAPRAHGPQLARNVTAAADRPTVRLFRVTVDRPRVRTGYDAGHGRVKRIRRKPPPSEGHPPTKRNGRRRDAHGRPTCRGRRVLRASRGRADGRTTAGHQRQLRPRRRRGQAHPGRRVSNTKRVRP